MAGLNYTQDKMYRLDLQDLHWDVLATKSDSGAVPGQIDEHTLCQLGDKAIIFGGFEEGCRNNKIRSFDLVTHKWENICPADANAKTPIERAGHSMNLIDTSLYIFGGKDEDNTKLKDLWKFDLENCVWTELVTPNSEQVPHARSGHSSVIYQGYLCVFGGIFEVTKELNDCHMYDIAQNRWITLFAWLNEPTTAQSPTKTLALGSVSPIGRKGTMKGQSSPKAGSNTGGMTKNNFSQAAPPK